MQTLIIDDQASQRTLLRMLLRHLLPMTGIREADGAASALRLLGQHPFDLVITDYRMPGLDGSRLLRALRALPAHDATPVVFVTAMPLDSVLSTLTGATHMTALRKPISLASLRDAIAVITTTRTWPESHCTATTV